MRKFLYFLIFCLVGLHANAQSRYYLYIQSEDRQPFYVRLSEKVYSSSEAGYLIIPKLDDGNYPVFLGFPKNAFPEQQFQVRMNKKDRGFQLKRADDKSWQLVNLQNQEVIANAAVGTIRNADLTGEKKTDAFSVMLSNVVNDSAILYTQQKPKAVETIVQKPQPAVRNEEVKQTIDKKDTEEEALVKKEAELITETKAETTGTDVNTAKPDTGYVTVKIKETESSLPTIKTTANTKAPDDKPFISKISEEKSTSMYKATYLEQYNYTTDTIDVSIPVETAPVVATRQPQLTREQEPMKEKTIVSTEIPTPVDTATAKKKIVIINSDCKNFASDNDVDKLRVRLIAAKNIDDKLAAARRYFRTKCFNVQQVRALTELFPSDETKYRFLDLAYAFTSDSGNYYQLEEVMNEEYYTNRFKAMIRK